MKTLIALFLLLTLPGNFFYALDPGERLVYTAAIGQGSVRFVGKYGLEWQVEVWHDNRLWETYWMYRGQILEETPDRPRLSRPETDLHLIVSSRKEKIALLPMLYVPGMVGGYR